MARIPISEDWFAGDDDIYETDQKGFEIFNGDDDDEWLGWIGTTTAAFVVDGGLILGSDKQKGRLGRIPLYALGKGLGFTRAGFEKHVDFMITKLQQAVVAEMDTTSFVRDIQDMPDFVLEEVRKTMGTDVGIPVKHKGHLLLGGFNKQGTVKPHLYYISNAGVLDILNAHLTDIRDTFQTGSGAGAAFIHLSARYMPHMSIPDGRKLMLETIYSAIGNDKNTGLGIEILVITPDEIGEVEQLTLEQYEEERSRAAPNG